MKSQYKSDEVSIQISITSLNTNLYYKSQYKSDEVVINLYYKSQYKSDEVVINLYYKSQYKSDEVSIQISITSLNTNLMKSQYKSLLQVSIQI